MTTSQEIHHFLNQLLEPGRFKDVCPNGWQVEGRQEVRLIVSGVTASQALIDAAIDAKADAIFVHHGLFWRGETRVTGWMRKRLGALIQHDINLFAYHLPLDAHPILGNNAQLGQRLGLEPNGRFGAQDLGWLGTSSLKKLAELSHTIKTKLNREPIVIGDSDRPIQTIAWCTGGAQSYFEAAIEAGADVFITGEISEPQAHYAHEMGVAYIACGHHASERYGAAALGAHVAAQLNVEHTFIDIDNPA